MAAISISHNIGTVAKQVQGKLTASNIKFGVAKTLTDLAKGSQERVRKELPRNFVIRRAWVGQGIRMKSATKSNLTSWVYSVDSGAAGRGSKTRNFMTLQEFGGTKSPETASHVAIPMKAVKPTPQTLIQQGWKPKNLLRYGPSRGAKQEGMKQRALAFKLQSKNHPGAYWIMMKRGGKYVPAWLMMPRAKIKATHFLDIPTKAYVESVTPRLLLDNLRAAMR